MNNYYVYAYIRKSTSIPYYIGKGKGKRAYEYHKGISVPKDRSKIIFLEMNLTNVGALALERRYIRWYGRKGLDEDGRLLNRTEGGEGNTAPRSDYQRARASAWAKNRRHSSETKLKIKLSQIGKVHKQAVCPHCLKSGIKPLISRWHGLDGVKCQAKALMARP